MKAMILAAGYGTRLKPLTDYLPKPLIMYRSKPMICYQIDFLKKAGADEIIVNTHHLSDMMENFFSENDFGIPIKLIHERIILGTGGGIINAKEFLVKSDYCIVVNTDIITNFNPSDIINGHQSSERDVTLLIQKRNSKKYLSFDTEMNFLGRYSDGSDNAIPYAFNGIHVISKNFFNIVSNDGFADIIDLYVQNKNRLNIKGYDAGGSKFIDIGKIENPEL